MKTFTQMKEEAAENCGLYPDSGEMTKVVRNIITGVKRFQSAARRYYTRQEKDTNTKEDQQYYQLSSDMLRVTGAKVLRSGSYHPLTEIKSEIQWDELNASGFGRRGTPTHFFVKGADEIGLYPVPAGDVVKGLKVSYEPRGVSLSVEDIKAKATMTQNSTVVTITSAETISQKNANNCWVTVTDGSDGNWYQVAKFIDSKTLHLDNNYQGADGTEVEILIGQCPPFPEEYHDAPVHYACHLFFLLRKDLESASMYKQLYDQAFTDYRSAYGNKTTGAVINRKGGGRHTDPRVFPGVITG